MNDAKEEIRERLAIEDVVGEYLELKRAGRNFKALSPFTNEKTPSFMVSPDKKIWHDFSSGKGGDIFSFVMEMEGYDFKEALRHLARKAGVELKHFSTASSQKIAKRKKRELEMYRLATTFYQLALTHNRHALDYVKSRNLNRTTLKEFKIGYSPNTKDALVQALEKKGFSKQEIAQAGLTNRFGGDLFRGRLMIPLSDQIGQTIGFTGRGLEPESIPKYLNTPSTLLYDKSRHVFALSQAKEAIRKANQAVIVEGNMDAISSHQAGIKQVVAAAGTALTADHLKTIGRFTSDVRLAFDGDKAGISAAERVIEISQTVGVDIKIISMPDSAKDPDELIQQGVKKWQQAIDEAIPAMDWLIEVYQEKLNIKTVQGRRDFSRKLVQIAQKLADPVEREAYLQKIAKIIDISVEALLKQVAEAKTPKKRLKSTEKASAAEVDEFLYQDNLLATGLLSEKVRTMLAEFDTKMLQNSKRQLVAKFLIDHQTETTQIDLTALQSEAVYAKILTLRAEERYSSWGEEDLVKEASRLLEQVKNDYQKHQIKQLTDQLRQAELDGDDALANRLREQINQLIKQ